MRQNKQTADLESVILGAITEALSNTHTALIAKVTKVNKTTINCKPVISRIVNNKKIDLPEFVEVPVINFLGGNSSIQMPISVGDYCVLFVSERAFDAWYEGYDFVEPVETRMHDYSDCIALVGLKNRAGELDIPQVITILGDTYQKGNYKHDGDREQNGNYTLNGDKIHKGSYTIEGNYTQTGDMQITGNLTLNGNLVVNGNITCTGVISAAGFAGLNGGAMSAEVDIVTSGDVKAGDISLKTHTHTDSEGGETSEPH